MLGCSGNLSRLSVALRLHRSTRPAPQARHLQASGDCKGMCGSAVWLATRINRLSLDLPGTIAGPRSPPRIARSRRRKVKTGFLELARCDNRDSAAREPRRARGFSAQAKAAVQARKANKPPHDIFQTICFCMSLQRGRRRVVHVHVQISFEINATPSTGRTIAGGGFVRCGKRFAEPFVLSSRTVLRRCSGFGRTSESSWLRSRPEAHARAPAQKRCGPSQFSSDTPCLARSALGSFRIL